jgi:hypothetical protein
MHSHFVLKTLFLKETGWFGHVENTFPTQTKTKSIFLQDILSFVKTDSE